MFFEKNSVAKIFTVVTSHLVRGRASEDKPYKANQAKILLNFLKTLKNPFILTGDFNLNPQTQIVDSFSQLAKNLILQKGITNTLNPRTHRLKELFPKGMAVDYIFVSEGIGVLDFHLVDHPDISDHLGLSLTFQV
jgi:endonuclease/exonuclease/phosphatase family metal-dependent hydrolase